MKHVLYLIILFLVTVVYSQTPNCTLPCSAGYFYANGSSFTSCSTNCTPCGPGEFSTGGINGKNCTQCSPGQYAAGYANVNCTQCPAGSFSSHYGSTLCTVCPLGTFSIANSASCTACSAGQFGNSTNASSCLNCSAGYHSPITGMSQCIACGEGFTTTNHISCTACPINTSTNIANNIFTCSVDCTNTSVFGFQFISSGFGGPCFDPADLDLNTTIRQFCNCNNAPAWAIATVSVLGGVILIILIVGIAYFVGLGSGGEVTAGASTVASGINSYLNVGSGIRSRLANGIRIYTSGKSSDKKL